MMRDAILAKELSFERWRLCPVQQNRITVVRKHQNNFQENIRQVVNMTTKALKHLLKYEGMKKYTL